MLHQFETLGHELEQSYKKNALINFVPGTHPEQPPLVHWMGGRKHHSYVDPDSASASQQLAVAATSAAVPLESAPTIRKSYGHRRFLCAHMHIHVCIYEYAFFSYVHIGIDTYMFICLYVYMCTCICAYMYTCIYVYM